MSALCLLLTLLGVDPAVQLPTTMQAKPGRLIQIAAKSEQKTIKWFLVGDDADLIVMESSKSAIFSATNPGSYKVIAWTASGDIPSDPAICVVQVGDSPAPVPPTPPAPVDPLQTTLQGIYGGLQDTKKNEYRRTLAAVYRQAATAINDPQLRTAGELYAVIRRSAVKALPDEALQPIRERLAEEIATVLPTDADAILTEDLRKKALNFYARAANILESIR